MSFAISFRLPSREDGPFGDDAVGLFVVESREMCILDDEITR